MSEFKMPSLGADMDAGTLVEWLKQPGEAVKRGDIIAVVETQKGAIEIEVFEDGVLSDIKVQPGTEVPVGSVLATISTDGSGASEPPAEAAPAPKQVEAPLKPQESSPETPEAPPSAPKSAPAQSTSHPDISPAARRAAEEKGVDISALKPGPSGIIGLAEVEAAAAPSAPRTAEMPAPKPTPAGGSRPGINLGAMRKAIAAAMSRSHREIPHYWVSQTIDLTPLYIWLERENRQRSVADRLLYVVPLLKAAALAVKETPALNGHYRDDEFQPSDKVHMGVATALRGGGLVAPAIHDVDRADLDTIRVGLLDLVQRTRAGRLRSSEMTDATVTLSNLGEDTSDALTSLIYPPQVAIIGCGAPLDRPHVVNGRIEIRRLMNVTVAGDHRVSDGRRASQFLGRFARRLETPEEL